MKLLISSILLLVIMVCWSMPTASQGTLFPTTARLGTPTPTFDSAIRENFLNLLKIDPDCLFPCWQGLKLGESSIEEAEQFGYEIFEQQGDYARIQRTDPYYPYDDSHSFDHGPRKVADGTVVGLKVIADDDVFSGLHIWYLGFDTSTDTQTLPNKYLIENVVEAYGSPDEIWLYGAPYTFITLVYSAKGLLIEYERVMREGNYDSNVRIICPDTFGGFTLTAYLPGDLDLSRFYKGFSQLDTSTAISPDEFIELVMERETDTDCIETPESIWPVP
ncbi:MAG: hypothetical protein DPW16_22230 [Chloroflexi bacterium]|nr:hypothetical protein [Chloroflexota bacterium]